MADPGVLFVTGVFLPTATSGRGGSGSLGPAVPGLELDQLGQRERERRLRPGFAAAAWAGPCSLRLVPWHGSRPGGRRLGGRRVLGDPPSQARGASARPASGLCSDLGTSVLRAERLQPSALSGGDALCADWGGSRRTPWRPRSGDCGVLGLSGHLGSNQWLSPQTQRPFPQSPHPPPLTQASLFSVNQKIPGKAKPSEQFPPWNVPEQRASAPRHGRLPPERAPFLSRLQSLFLQLVPHDSWWSSVFHSDT